MPFLIEPRIRCEDLILLVLHIYKYMLVVYDE